MAGLPPNADTGVEERNEMEDGVVDPMRLGVSERNLPWRNDGLSATVRGAVSTVTAGDSFPLEILVLLKYGLLRLGVKVCLVVSSSLVWIGTKEPANNAASSCWSDLRGGVEKSTMLFDDAC